VKCVHAKQLLQHPINISLEFLCRRTAKNSKVTIRQIIEALQQVMSTHDAEKLAITLHEIYKDS
jgi:hypothetical protein